MAYGIHKPKLKCELFLDKQEKKEVESLLKNISSDFITIEPHSNTDYTVNRSYPFEKWESVVKELSKKIQVVQIGTEKNKLLSRVVDLR